MENLSDLFLPSSARNITRIRIVVCFRLVKVRSRRGMLVVNWKFRYFSIPILLLLLLLSDLLLTVGFHLSCIKVSCINHSIDALYLPFNEGNDNRSKWRIFQYLIRSERLNHGWIEKKKRIQNTVKKKKKIETHRVEMN